MVEKKEKTKAVPKAVKYINDATELSNSRTWIDFLDKETLNLYPGRDDWRQRLIYTMMKWSEKSTSLEILQFCMEYKIPRTTLYAWCEKYADIKDAYINMRLAIACHRRVGTMNKKLDGAYAYKDMHVYDQEWDSINKYHSDMKKEEEKQSHTFIINDTKPRVIGAKELIDSLKDNE